MEPYIKTNQLFSGSYESIQIKTTDKFVYVPLPNWWADVPNLGPTEMGQLIEPYAISAINNSYSHARAHAPLDGYIDNKRRYTGPNLGVRLFQRNRDLGLYGMRHNLSHVTNYTHRSNFSGTPIEIKYTYGSSVKLTATQWSILNHFNGILAICKHAYSPDNGNMLLMALYTFDDGEIINLTVDDSFTVPPELWKTMDNTKYDLL